MLHSTYNQYRYAQIKQQNEPTKKVKKKVFLLCVLCVHYQRHMVNLLFSVSTYEQTHIVERMKYLYK